MGVQYTLESKENDKNGVVDLNALQSSAKESVSPAPSQLRSTLRATTLLTASWFGTLFVGLVSSKVLAIVLGPGGFGYYGLMQNFVELVSLVVGLGMSVGLVRCGAMLIAKGDQTGMAGLRQGSWLILGSMGLLAVVALKIFKATLNRWFLGDAEDSGAVVVLAFAVLFTVASYVQVSTLNAYHRIKALALCGVWSKTLAAAFSIMLLLVWGLRALAPAAVIAAISGWLVSGWLLRGELECVTVRVSFRQACAGACSLLKVGVPYIGSAALSKGASLILPIMVLQMLGTAGVGYYRAASAVAVTYLGFLVAAMTQDYFPRIAAVCDKPRDLCQVVNEQQRLVLLVSAPMILGMLALVPYAVPLVYSPKFRPAIELLEWSLIGDLFRLSSVTMSIVILARCSGKALLFTESLLAASILGTSWLGIRWLGLPGLGVAFLLSYVIYYVAAWMIVRRETGLRFSRANVKLALATIAAAVLVRLLPYTGFPALRTPIALTLAAIAGLGSFSVLSREIGEIERIAPFQRVLSGVIARIKTAVQIA